MKDFKNTILIMTVGSIITIIMIILSVYNIVIIETILNVITITLAGAIITFVSETVFSLFKFIKSLSLV